ncbi:hypothetical protein AB0C29_24940 [Actinoplanes sp. NPDC048791]|uniref:hypothetical protein n=1 Tax=Actinoplanes sp. NPDC048791 TaxID=3154623 RepID=UPI00340A6517
MDRSLAMHRRRLEHLLGEEDDLRRLLARVRRDPEPPPIQLTAELRRREVDPPNRDGRIRLQTGSSSEWVRAKLGHVRQQRENAERRFLHAAQKADEESTVGVPPVTTPQAPTPSVRAGVPTWVVGVVVVLGALVFVGGSNSGSVLLPVLGLVVAVIGLVPTTISAYFDFRAHQRRNRSRTGTDRDES